MSYLSDGFFFFILISFKCGKTQRTKEVMKEKGGKRRKKKAKGEGVREIKGEMDEEGLTLNGWFWFVHKKKSEMKA